MVSPCLAGHAHTCPSLLHPRRVLQVKYIFGVKITMGSSTRLQDYLAQYLSQIRNLRWEEFVMGVTCMIILIAFRVSFQAWLMLYFSAATKQQPSFALPS